MDDYEIGLLWRSRLCDDDKDKIGHYANWNHDDTLGRFTTYYQFSRLRSVQFMQAYRTRSLFHCYAMFLAFLSSHMIPCHCTI